jgi:alkaline phosphatase D
MKKIYIFLLGAVFCSACNSSRPVSAGSDMTPKRIDATLVSGPMLGYADMKEVLIWAQVSGPADVAAEYWEQGKPDVKFKTDPYATQKNEGYTARMIADQLEPGRTYEYHLLINGKTIERPYPTVFKTQTLWQYRTDPPAFSVATGSCAYINETEYDRPGKPYGSHYQIFKAVNDQKPDIMLWLGDNVYYREPDFYSLTGMLHRYTHDRALPELQPLLASTPQYAIWDDHDYGPNDSDGSYVHKEMAWDVFRYFWGNPTYGVNGQKGCTTWFKYNDVDFFLLDNRYFRTPNECKTCPRTALGAEQLEWFKAALAASEAPFKLVAIGGQFLTTSNNSETYAHYYKAERDSILAFIERENIKNVVFLTGDRHFTEMSALKNARGNMVYDLTTSPFTSGLYNDADKRETNGLRMDGAIAVTHNFSMLRFSGPRKKRQMEVAVYDADGKEMWRKTILQNE